MIIATLNPSTGTDSGGTDVLVVGDNFLNTSAAACKFGTVVAPASFLSDKAMLCTAPPNLPGTLSVEVTSNGADFSFSGEQFSYYPQAKVTSIWPVLGFASEGGTVTTIRGEGFQNSAELVCNFGEAGEVGAVWLSSMTVLCKTPRHRPGLVMVQVANNGMDFSPTGAEYLYVNDIALKDVRPVEVLETGQVPVLVTGFNFMNTSTLACRFGATVVQASFVTPWLVACMAPSHSTQPRLQRKLGTFSVEVSVNGLDYTDSGKTIEYIQASVEGQYAQNWIPALCPNGTYCTGMGNLNFTLCEPGSFQPSSGAGRCLSCPVGFICPGSFSWLILPYVEVSRLGLNQNPSEYYVDRYCVFKSPS